MRQTDAYLVTLKIRSSRRARNTLIPKDVPGLMVAHITSKMLPKITWTCKHTCTIQAYDIQHRDNQLELWRCALLKRQSPSRSTQTHRVHMSLSPRTASCMNVAANKLHILIYGLFVQPVFTWKYTQGSLQHRGTLNIQNNASRTGSDHVTPPHLLNHHWKNMALLLRGRHSSLVKVAVQ